MKRRREADSIPEHTLVDRTRETWVINHALLANYKLAYLLEATNVLDLVERDDDSCIACVYMLNGMVVGVVEGEIKCLQQLAAALAISSTEVAPSRGAIQLVNRNFCKSMPKLLLSTSDQCTMEKLFSLSSQPPVDKSCISTLNLDWEETAHERFLVRVFKMTPIEAQRILQKKTLRQFLLETS